MEAKEIPFKDIFDWVAVTNAEAIDDDFYHQTDVAKKVLKMIKTSPYGALIAVIGWQGIGKTRMMQWLQKELGKKAFSLKWISISHLRQLYAYFFGVPGPRSEDRPAIIKLHHTEKPMAFFIKRTLLIDLPDYTKRTVSLRDKHLDDIQWCRNLAMNFLRSRSYIKGAKSQLSTLVLFIQKELYTDHFFLNKFTKFELERIAPETLVDIFDFKFSKHPFAEGAVHQIAVLSRGIFRRFQDYIRLCMNEWLDKYEETAQSNQITIENVNEWIPTQKITKDMDLELSKCFRAPERRVVAAKVLKFLKKNEETGQAELISKFFDGNKMRASRILHGLEKGGYIACIKKGKFKYWRLKEW